MTNSYPPSWFPSSPGYSPGGASGNCNVSSIVGSGGGVSYTDVIYDLKNRIDLLEQKLSIISNANQSQLENCLALKDAYERYKMIEKLLS